MFNNQTAENVRGNHFGRGGRGCGGFRGAMFGKQMAPWMRQFAAGFGSQVSVNIEETDSAYFLHLYAPGLVKEHITLSVKDDVLSIAYKAGESKDDKFTHQEFNTGNFERLFQLNEKVIVANISAAYADGILKVTLPKDPEKAKPAQKINVS